MSGACSEEIRRKIKMHKPFKATLLSYTPNAAELLQRAVGISYPTPGFDSPIQKRAVKFASGRIIPFVQLGLTEDPPIGQPLAGYTKDDKFVAEIIPSSADRFVRFLLKIGHMKPFEMVNATFLLEGISRKTALHLVRYEFVTTNFRSQKYLDQSSFEYVLPESGEESQAVIDEIEEYYEATQHHYERLRNMGADPEWQRIGLPNGTAQTMSFHTNIRQYRHIFDCLCAETYVRENQRTAMAMFNALKKVMPVFFPDFVVDFDPKLEIEYARRPDTHRNVQVNWAMSEEDKKELGLFVPFRF